MTIGPSGKPLNQRIFRIRRGFDLPQTGSGVCGWPPAHPQGLFTGRLNLNAKETSFQRPTTGFRRETRLIDEAERSETPQASRTLLDSLAGER
jgi:hypothetical protein